MRATTRFCARLLAVLALAGASVSAQRGGPIAQQLVFSPYHASGVYKVGETVGRTVTLGPTPPTYAYKWTIRRNNAVVLKEATRVWTALNQIAGPVEVLPMIESEHDNLTPDKDRACPAPTNDIVDLLVHGGTFTPRTLAPERR